MPKSVTIRGSRVRRETVTRESEPVAPATESTSAPLIEEEKAARLGFYLGADEASVNWERFKSPSGREKMQTIIKREAERMGYAPKVNTEALGPDAVTGAMVFGLVNALILGAGKPLNLTSEEVAFLQLSEKEQETLNGNGRMDRLVKKYLGDTTFKYADEVFTGIVLLALVNAKVQGIKALRVKPGMVRSIATGEQS